ncbi:MAG: S8 family serine peptidase, partial [Candidatus Aenigmatarchaeota archaeon]
MAVQRNIVKYLFFLLLFFSVLNLETSSSAYLISKNKLDEILNSNCFLFDIHSELKIKCYFDLICSAEKPIKGFENYFLKDEKIFELLRLDGLRIIDAYNAWNSGLDFYLFGDSSKVGIIDSGIDTTHKDFDLSKYKCFYSINGEVKENDWSYCNDSDGHGTHVAGIVAGKYDKNISKCLNNYPCGVAPNATLFIARVFSGPTANLLDILNALDWIVENNVNIISMSFGADLSMLRLNSCYPLGNSSEEVTILLFSTLMDFLAIENNLILIAAAGNNPNSISTPACAKSVIAVGAIDKNRNLAFFSSRGPIDNRTKPDIVAPGVSINSTYPQNTYSIASGTSMATPFVSGAIALLLDMLNKENTTVTSQEVKAILLTSANELTRNNTFGSGILNVSEMIRIRNNFLTIDVEDGEVLRFKVNKTDSYPFKFTIYRHETVLDFTKYNVKIIKDGAIIFEGESIFDNVFQYKNDTLNGDFEIEVKINHNSTMVDNKFTFVFSHRILNLSKFLEENLNNSIQPMLNVTIDPSIEFGLNPINRRIGIFVSDFAGMPIRADIINVSIVNSSGNIIHSSLHFNTDSIYLEIPSDLTEFNYTLYVVAEKGKRFGVVSKNFTYTPFYLISPNKVLKVMNGDLLNITINFDNNINNITILEAFLYLEGNKDEKLNISFSFNDNIAYNITNINLNQKGKYFLFLNVSLGENTVEFEIPILEFSPIFDYTISYPRYMFADKEYTINIDIFHINGSRVNIEKTICIENDTNKIFCNSSLSNNIKIFTNISVSGDYNLNISAIDNNGNFLNEKIPITINFIPDRIIINKQKEKFTILEPLDVSAEIINSTKNSQCSFCTVFVNMTKDGKIIFSRKSFEDFKNFVIPKDFESGKYKLTFFSQTNSTILNETEIEIETLEILTNVSEKVFPNYYDVYINISVNATSNVSISISRINISEESIQLNPSIDIETISGCENKSIDETNKILWCNSTSDIILKINSSETSTFFIEIIAYGDNINGYLLDKFYSGFLIRPHINSKKKSCDEISLEDTLINPYIKNNCFVDSRNQRDMSINRNERVLFSAIAYAGATLDKIISTNVTINVTYNGITKYLNSSSFENLIFFNISNFTDLGKYAINLTYVFKDNEIEISKQELYEINVYDINYSITIPKNYTKIFGILSFISQINRTNGISEEKIRNITRISSETPSVKIASYNLNTTSSKLIFNVTFEKSFNGDVKIKIEDELGIEKDI